MSRVPQLLVVVVVLVLIAGNNNNLVAADKCKKTLRTVFFERCRVRNKRDSPLMDSFGGLSTSETEPVVHQQPGKRQIMSIREIFLSSSGLPMYHHASYPSYTRQQQYDIPAVPASDVYRAQPSRSLPPESHSELGFETSYEEMNELLDELYARMPRGTKSREDVQKEFLPLFEECCKNVELCKMKRDCPYN